MILKEPRQHLHETVETTEQTLRNNNKHFFVTFRASIRVTRNYCYIRTIKLRSAARVASAACAFPCRLPLQFEQRKRRTLEQNHVAPFPNQPPPLSPSLSPIYTWFTGGVTSRPMRPPSPTPPAPSPLPVLRQSKGTYATIKFVRL